MSVLKLLPYSKKALLTCPKDRVKVIYLIDYFMNIAIECVDCICEGNFNMFDPHVGDTACQIRAYQLQLIANNIYRSSELPELFKLKQNIQEHRKKLEQRMKECRAMKKKRHEKINIIEFIKAKSLDVELPWYLIFCIQFYFLTVHNIKRDGITVGIDYARVVSDVNISLTQARSISKRFQRRVAKISNTFVLHLAKLSFTTPNVRGLLFRLKKK